MIRRRHSEDRRCKAISLRITKEQHDALKKACKARKMSISQFVELTVMSQVEKELSK